MDKWGKRLDRIAAEEAAKKAAKEQTDQRKLSERQEAGQSVRVALQSIVEPELRELESALRARGRYVELDVDHSSNTMSIGVSWAADPKPGVQYSCAHLRFKQFGATEVVEVRYDPPHGPRVPSEKWDDKVALRALTKEYVEERIAQFLDKALRK